MTSGRKALAVLLAGAALVVAGFTAWTLRASDSTMTQAPAARTAARVVGRVELPAGTAPPAAPAQVVVYAFALDGPRLPLAVLRRPATDLPFDYTLDDKLAPNPAFRLSQATQVVVGARLGSGDAVQAQRGDWIAAAQTVPLGAHGVRLVLQPPRP